MNRCIVAVGRDHEVEVAVGVDVAERCPLADTAHADAGRLGHIA